MQNQPISYQGCPICTNPTQPVPENNYKVVCTNCGGFLITANAINDWLLSTVPEFRKREAVRYIHNNKDVLIDSLHIQNFLDQMS